MPTQKIHHTLCVDLDQILCVCSFLRDTHYTGIAHAPSDANNSMIRFNSSDRPHTNNTQKQRGPQSPVPSLPSTFFGRANRTKKKQSVRVCSMGTPSIPPGLRWGKGQTPAPAEAPAPAPARSRSPRVYVLRNSHPLKNAIEDYAPLLRYF